MKTVQVSILALAALVFTRFDFTQEEVGKKKGAKIKIDWATYNESKNYKIEFENAIPVSTVKTIAGDGTAGYRGDGGPAAKAQFRDPHSLLVDADDNIYISDLDNHRVRKIDSRTNRITSLVGNGKRGFPEDGGLASDQPFITPQGLALRDGKLWIASPSSHCVWRFDVRSGQIYRAAGRGMPGHTGDGGDPLQATFDGPRGVWLTAAGVLCVAEGENNVIRAFDTVRNAIRTIAGAGPKQQRYTGDGGPAVQAPIWQPHGVLEIEDGQLLISDTKNHRVTLLKPVARGH